jgi:hypothetical protein
MNIRVKAALYTAGLLSSGIIIVLAVNRLIEVLTAEQIGTAIMAGLIGFSIYCLYSITLNRLEYEARIKEIQDKK